MSEIHQIKVHCSFSKMADPRTLKPHELNPNEHPEKQIDLFTKILMSNGWRRPITVSSRSNVVTKGHGALMAALAMGLPEVPVDLQPYDSEELELADMLADNKLAAWSSINPARQQIVLERLNGQIDLELTGMDQGTLDKLFAEMAAAPALNLGEGPNLVLGEGSSGTNVSPDASNPEVPSNHVRMVQLFLNAGNLPEFEKIVAHFREKLGKDNTTDTVLEVLRNAYSADQSNLPASQV